MNVSDETVKQLSTLFKMLADESRLKIVLALVQQGRMHVKALGDIVKQTQPAVSHHLTLMRIARVVDYDRVGKNNYYYLASDQILLLIQRFFNDAGNDSLTVECEDFDLAFKAK